MYAVVIHRGITLSTQILLEGNIDTAQQQRIERILMLQLGTMANRFAHLKATISQGDEKVALEYQCTLVATLKQGGRLEFSMENSGLHVCVADAAARLVREARRVSSEPFLGGEAEQRQSAK